MVAFDDLGSRSVTPLHRVGEAVLDTRVDLELSDAAREELPLDRGDERPHQSLAPVRRIDEHVQEARAGVRPCGPGDREADQ